MEQVETVFVGIGKYTGEAVLHMKGGRRIFITNVDDETIVAKVKEHIDANYKTN